MAWTFVALGDSLTEGVGDPQPDGTLRGWADRLAAWLRPAVRDFRYLNLAHRGLTTRTILDGQLEPALEARPSLASVLAGMNDVIRPTFDVGRYAEDLGHMVGSLAGAGATVLTATFPDVSRALFIPPAVRSTLRRRLHEASAAVRDVAVVHDAVCLDVWNAPEPLARGVLSIDRLHPSPRGHLLLALRFAELLEDRLGIRLVLPDPEAPGPAGAGVLGQARWLARNALPSVIRTVIRSPRLARGTG